MKRNSNREEFDAPQSSSRERPAGPHQGGGMGDRPQRSGSFGGDRAPSRGGDGFRAAAGRDNDRDGGRPPRRTFHREGTPGGWNRPYNKAGSPPGGGYGGGHSGSTQGGGGYGGSSQGGGYGGGSQGGGSQGGGYGGASQGGSSHSGGSTQGGGYDRGPRPTPAAAAATPSASQAQPVSRPVPAHRLKDGLRAANRAIAELMEEFGEGITGAYDITELQAEVSFDDAGRFLGFGKGGSVTFTLALTPLDAEDVLESDAFVPPAASPTKSKKGHNSPAPRAGAANADRDPTEAPKPNAKAKSKGKAGAEALDLAKGSEAADLDLRPSAAELALDPELDAESGAEFDAKSGAELDAETGAELDAESGAELDAESGAELDAETGAELDAEMDADLEPMAEVDESDEGQDALVEQENVDAEPERVDAVNELAAQGGDFQAAAVPQAIK